MSMAHVLIEALMVKEMITGGDISVAEGFDLPRLRSGFRTQQKTKNVYSSPE